MFNPPTVLDAQGLLDKAFHRASKATSSKGRNRIERGRNLAVAKIQTAADVLTSALERYTKGFPSLDRIPPFYRELIDATVGVLALRKNLAAINWARTKIRELQKAYPRRIQHAGSPQAIAGIRSEAFGRFSSVIKQIANALKGLQDARFHLRHFPDIDPELPTIVVAGYPNVGKSQFMRSVSSGKPRVAPYPFTTKGVSVGHLEIRYSRYQVLDTPGLLDRPMEKRNPMERQAIAALAHLADLVVFLLDPSETCGYDLPAQLRLLDEVRTRFPEVPILVVENKCDILRAETDRPKVSALTGEGVKEILADAIRLATSHVPAAAPPLGSG